MAHVKEEKVLALAQTVP